MSRINEIEARLSAIAVEVETASDEALTALETEANTLIEERNAINAAAEKRAAVISAVSAGAGKTFEAPKTNESEQRANAFVKSGKMTVDAAEARSTLISGGTLATPTGVSGINDAVGAKYSSIIDMVKVVNCVGMGSNKVAYVSEGSSASAQTEGSAITGSDPTFGYVTLTPTSIAVLSQVSDQVKKQSPLLYRAKIQELALSALRRKAAEIVVDAIVASDLNTSVSASLASGKGKIDETTLRKLVLGYGGNEAVGEGVLFLNKTDLVAFGDVRGTNEKKAVYEIIPDSANPNTGVIKDGGLSVKYCLSNDITACSGTAQGSAAIKTMFYGAPTCAELDLFGDYEIAVSTDRYFESRMDAIRGAVDLDADVVVDGGFAVLTIGATA